MKGPNGNTITDLECKYQSDYIALKLTPEISGKYSVNFYDQTNSEILASSPYKLLINRESKEIMKSAGIYDVTRLTISENYLLADYELSQFSVNVFG